MCTDDDDGPAQQTGCHHSYINSHYVPYNKQYDGFRKNKAPRLHYLTLGSGFNYTLKQQHTRKQHRASLINRVCQSEKLIFYLHSRPQTQWNHRDLSWFGDCQHVLILTRTDQWGPSCCGLSSQWHQAAGTKQSDTLVMFCQLGPGREAASTQLIAALCCPAATLPFCRATLAIARS